MTFLTLLVFAVPGKRRTVYFLPRYPIDQVPSWRARDRIKQSLDHYLGQGKLSHS
ncbi:hypothetical protein MYAER_0345 [Microcystis aeruginosa NIES-2549]|uniref:Uncharacterized protein n=1 Tax=Microcystis aeruginosa NIES-2549 TaxID=1641812 RepID=A0A0F6U141_MICAE|nr:hypothetical protein MYAER_0345 [Microcystis aeruginosa NIES-2549]AOC51094.1 hypothetical protein amyaer_0343 [Microcystis aeruginosa NIES-2481]